MDLDEAAKFTKYDFRSSFLSTLHDFDLFELARDVRLDALRARIKEFNASLLRKVEVPKSSLLSRPASLPIVDDWIVYTAAVVAIARQVEANLIPTGQEVLFSFRWIEEDPVRTFRSKHLPFQAFRKKSVHLVEEYPYALQTDISSYFEHIDLEALRGVLLRLGAQEDGVRFLLDRMLRRWTHESGRGIPQGPWASSYLANLFLDSVDRAMLQYGYNYIRYMDDMRVFCYNRSEARLALLRLNQIVRGLGLSLQAAKTQILDREKARRLWRGFEDRLADLEDKVGRELIEIYTRYGPYGDVEIDEDIPEMSEVAQIALRELFDEITTRPAFELERSGFKFVLNRLGKLGSDCALEFCLTNLPDLPDVAIETAGYISKFADRPEVQQRVVQFLGSTESIFDWQAMHLISSILEVSRIIPHVLELAFRTACDLNRHFGLRAVCVDIVGKHGSYQQVQELRRRFVDEQHEEVRAAIILGSRQLDVVEKSRFLEACRGLSPALDAAVGIASRA